MSLKTKTLKKAISTLTTLSTVVWLSGMSMFAVSVNVASAAIVDGDLIRSNETNSDGTPTLAALDVYIVKLVGTKTFKRLIINPQVYESYGHFDKNGNGNPWDDIQNVNKSVVDSYKTSSLVRVDGDPAEKVYALAPAGDVGSKSWVNLTAVDFLAVTGSDADSIYTINSTDGGNYNAVGDLTTKEQLATFYASGTLPGAVAPGALTAELSASTPAAGTIVAGQATASMTDVTFTGSGTVNTVILKRSGISDQNTLSNVYLYDGVNRITEAYSFNSSGEITINGIGLVVSGSKTVSIKADVLAGTGAVGQTVAVGLKSFTAAGATATEVSVTGNAMSVVSGTALATATLSANTVTGTPSVNAGITAYTFWSAPIQVNTRAVQLKAANFRVIGSAPIDALSNIKLFVDGVDTTKVATMTTMTGSNYAVFDLSAEPLSLSTGTHTIDVRANVEKGSNRTVQFSVQTAADLSLMDPQLGVNLAVGGTVPNSAVSITISTGSVTISIDSAFSAISNVTGGASNVDIAKYKVHAYGEDVKISSLVVTPVVTSMTPATSTLDNVTLFFNGSQVGTQQDFTGANLSFTLGSQMIAPAGTDSILEVRADIRSSAAVNYTAGNVSADLVVGSGNAQGQNSLASISTPAKTGNILSVQTGLLAVSKNTGYASQNVNPNTAGVKIGSFTLQNQSSSESVRVTTLSVALSGTAALTNFGALKTSETSGSGATPVQPQTSNTFSVDLTLAPGATKSIDILADSGSATSGTIIATLTVTSIGVTSNVSATSSAITGQTITLSAGTVTDPPTLVASSSTVAQLIASANGGATDASKAVFNFLSTGGASTISELKFVAGSLPTTYTSGTITVAGADTLVVGSTTGYTAGDTVIVVTNGTNAVATITTVTNGTNLAVTYSTAGAGTPSLVVVDKSTVTAVKVGSVSAPVVAGVAYLTGLSLAVPFGGSGLNQDVLVSYSETGISGVTSTTNSKLALTYVKYSSGGTTTTIKPTVQAPTMTLVGSKPVFTVADSSDTLSNSQVKIAEITITADAKGDVKLGKLPISVKSTGVVTVVTGANNIVIKDTNNTVITTTNTGLAVAAGGTGTDTIIFGTTSANSYLIPAGTSKTFRIYVTPATVGGAVNTTSLSTSLGAAASVEWYDVAGNNTTAITAASVFNYPTDTSVITN